MKMLSLLFLLLTYGTSVGFSTADLTADSKVAFVGNSLVQGTSLPTALGSNDYAVWESTGYYSQTADWAWRLCYNVGWSNYRVFATSGQKVIGGANGGIGIHEDYTPDVVAWNPDIVFILAGINDAYAVTQIGESYTTALDVVSALTDMVSQLQAVGAKVVIVTLHGIASFATWNASTDSCRVAINTGISEIGLSDDFAVHTDYFLHDSTGTYWPNTDPPLEKINLQAAYDNGDHLHLNKLGYYRRADTLWVNTLESLTFGTGGRTFYINPETGHDWLNTGTTAAAPFRTLQCGLNHAGAGDIIEMATGEYDMNTDMEDSWYLYRAIRMIRTGSSADPIQINGNGSTFTNIIPIEYDDRYVANSYYSLDSTYVTFSDISFIDYTYAFDFDDERGLRFDDCTFLGSGIQLDGTSYVSLNGCQFSRDSTYATGKLLRIDDCDSLIVVGCNFDCRISSQNDVVYWGVNAPGTGDVYRFINCEFIADGVDARPLYMANNLTGTLEIRNSILSNPAGYAFVLKNTLTYDADVNFLRGTLSNSGTVSIASWCSTTGGANQWLYMPNLSDTLRYGGVTDATYGSHVDRPEEHKWVSIGTTQYAVPSVTDRFALLQDADSLLVQLPWVWSLGDTIRYLLSEIDDYYEIADYLASDPQLTIEVVQPDPPLPQIPLAIQDLVLTKLEDGFLQLTWSPVQQDIIGEPFAAPVIFQLQSAADPFTIDDWENYIQITECSFAFPPSEFPEGAFFRVIAISR